MSPIAPQFSAQAQNNAKEKNAEAASPITVKDLSEQIRIALSDFFIAEIRSVSSNHLEMKFPSGEAFYITKKDRRGARRDGLFFRFYKVRPKVQRHIFKMASTSSGVRVLKPWMASPPHAFSAMSLKLESSIPSSLKLLFSPSVSNRK